MSTTDTIAIELDKAERQTLAHLLDHFVRSRSWEAIQLAHRASEIARGAEQGRLLAQLYGLTEDDGLLAVADLDAQRANLILWAMETESSVAEHEATICDVDEGPGDREQINKTIDGERALIVEDYAHRCVCERIVGQIDAAREAVA